MTITLINLAAIEMDSSIQCREAIDAAVVNEYADRMTIGDAFPPCALYGDPSRCWIGDGWHRVFAAHQIGAGTIAARLYPGGRTDALKAALSANVRHGLHRSNADKRRCVEIAVREFPTLSSRAVAEMCGVDDKTVASCRPVTCGNSAPEKTTGQDGKQYPAKKKKKKKKAGTATGGGCPKESGLPPSPTSECRVLGAPRDGMQFARMAIMDLEQIRPDDLERQEAFTSVKEWLNARET